MTPEESEIVVLRARLARLTKAARALVDHIAGYSDCAVCGRDSCDEECPLRELRLALAAGAGKETR